jgi:hypothetical protein
MMINTPDTLITPSCITAKALFQHLAPTHWGMLCWPQTWHPGHLMTHHGLGLLFLALWVYTSDWYSPTYSSCTSHRPNNATVPQLLLLCMYQQQQQQAIKYRHHWPCSYSDSLSDIYTMDHTRYYLLIVMVLAEWLKVGPMFLVVPFTGGCRREEGIYVQCMHLGPCISSHHQVL